MSLLWLYPQMTRCNRGQDLAEPPEYADRYVCISYNSAFCFLEKQTVR